MTSSRNNCVHCSNVYEQRISELITKHQSKFNLDEYANMINLLKNNRHLINIPKNVIYNDILFAIEMEELQEGEFLKLVSYLQHLFNKNEEESNELIVQNNVNGPHENMQIDLHIYNILNLKIILLFIFHVIIQFTCCDNSLYPLCGIMSILFFIIQTNVSFITFENKRVDLIHEHGYIGYQSNHFISYPSYYRYIPLINTFEYILDNVLTYVIYLQNIL